MCRRWAPGGKVSALIASHCGHEFEQTLGDGKDREAWRAAVHGVARSWTRLHDRTTKKTVSICCHRQVWWPFFLLISLHSQGWRETFAVSRRFGVTSLVAQWLRIHVPMQGAWVQSLLLEDSTCCRSTKLAHCGARARPQEEPPQWEARTPHLENSLRLPQLEKALTQKWRRSAVKK